MTVRASAPLAKGMLLSRIVLMVPTVKLVFAGVTTEVCVQTSMREANDRGYECLLIEDATASYFPAFKQAALDQPRSCDVHHYQSNGIVHSKPSHLARACRVSLVAIALVDDFFFRKRPGSRASGAANPSSRRGIWSIAFR